MSILSGIELDSEFSFSLPIVLYYFPSNPKKGDDTEPWLPQSIIRNWKEKVLSRFLILDHRFHLYKYNLNARCISTKSIKQM